VLVSATFPDSLELRLERLFAEGRSLIEESKRTIAESRKLRARCRDIYSRQDRSLPEDDKAVTPPPGR
jgi:hypothetical protein